MLIAAYFILVHPVKPKTEATLLPEVIYVIDSLPDITSINFHERQYRDFNIVAHGLSTVREPNYYGYLGPTQLRTCNASIDWVLTGIAYPVITGDDQTVTDLLCWARLQIPLLSPPSSAVLTHLVLVQTPDRPQLSKVTLSRSMTQPPGLGLLDLYTNWKQKNSGIVLNKPTRHSAVQCTNLPYLF